MRHRLITTACITSALVFGSCARRDRGSDELESAADRVGEEARELGEEVERVAERAAERAREATDRDEARGTASNASVMKFIPDARCEREIRCDNIGAGKDYSTPKDCMDEIATEWRDDLNAIECPGGIDRAELSECLEEIRNEDCGNPFDTLGRVVACRSSDLCSTT